MRSGRTDEIDRADAPTRSRPTEPVDRADPPLSDEPRSSEALRRGDTIGAEAARQGRIVLTSSARRWVFLLGLAGAVILVMLVALA